MPMTPSDFAAKWGKIQVKETSAYASHFDDLCRLAGHPTPIEQDPEGKDFSFQAAALKADGQKGFADVFYRDHFIMEYKGLHADLGKAYQQLQLYREALDNPPLLITCDLHTIRIHTNFTNHPTVVHTVTLDDIAAGPGLEVLRRVFYDPASFTPEKTRENITKATADTFLAVAESLRQHQALTGEAYSAEQRAHFLIRLLFCLFAEDLGLLPKGIFTNIMRAQGSDYDDLRHPLRGLFAAMRDGGHFGYHRIRHFNGTLFDDEFVPSLPADLARKVLRAAEQDWSAVDPSIFGTLFERIIDEGKRAQLGAHYTSKDDILLIVEPVLMEPLRRRWDEVRQQANALLGSGLVETGRRPVSTAPVSTAPAGDAYALLAAFAAEIAATRVLDPACGSGNFLYVALRRLLDLQKEVIAYAARKGLPDIPLSAGPEQLYGIEINEYAHELAQITVWIGYLQWRYDNGFAEMAEPILRPLTNIKHMDAILAYDEAGKPVEPEWPAAEVIIGNPPFLGGKKLLGELGSKYVGAVRSIYEGRLPNFSDLVTFWFEQARNAIEQVGSKRAGLIATNSIGMGTNLPVLERIKASGDIFMAWDDRDWVLDGAAVRVAIVGFDNGEQKTRTLNGVPVPTINADLTSGLDLTQAKQLDENRDLGFIGTQKSGSFDLPLAIARQMIETTNPSGVLNHEVIVPWVNGLDLARRPRDMYIIDFPASFSEEEASRYILPFRHVLEVVKPERTASHFEGYPFWLHWNTRPSLRRAVQGLPRYAATPRVAKHRLMVWLSAGTNADSQVVVFARDDDYFFGVLHSRPHELWSLRMGTWLGVGNDPRYTPTTTFETFPFPWPPGKEPAEADDPRVAAIGRWARELVRWRDAWLNPPPDEAQYLGEKRLKARTLTNLYNGLVYVREHPGPAFSSAEFTKETRGSVSREEVIELDDIHRALDSAVLSAYGWLPDSGQAADLSDEAILERLLALNLERASS